MRTTLSAVALLALSLCTACAPTYVRNAYVDPSGSCGYTVNIGGYQGKDIVLSKCMTLEEAKELANLLNKDMAGKWSWTNRGE